MPEPIRRRNPVARSPLLRKGGVHQRSRTGERQESRVALSHGLAVWQEDLAFERAVGRRDHTDPDDGVD